MRNFLIAVMLVFTVAGVVQAEQVGDMDGDGQVGVKEAIIALQVAAGLYPGGLGHVISYRYDLSCFQIGDDLKSKFTS